MSSRKAGNLGVRVKRTRSGRHYRGVSKGGETRWEEITERLYLELRTLDDRIRSGAHILIQRENPCSDRSKP